MAQTLANDPRRAATTAERLAGGLTVAAGFTAAARAAALDRVRAVGLPSRRDEYWRFADPAALNALDVAPVALAPDPTAALFSGLARITITFVDGVFDPGQSGDLAAEGIEIATLAGTRAQDLHWARDLYGALEARGQMPVPRPLAALNTATATDGVLIRVTGKPSRPVHLVYLRRDAAADVMLHHVIRLDPGAEMTLLESGPGAARLGTVTEVEVAAGARFHHVRAQGPDAGRLAATHLFARLGAGSLFKSFTVTMNGALTRNEAVIELMGDGGTAHVAGAALGDGAGAGFVQDDTVFVTHDAVGCESRQVFKKVLKRGATGIFQGKILVKPGAQKTDGYQISQALLLDEDSQFLAKPELEIYADDVKCSHGSTTGAIDETALFYLRSRGVPREDAVRLLVLSFLAAALDEIDDEGLRGEVGAALEDWLARKSD